MTLLTAIDTNDKNDGQRKPRLVAALIQTWIYIDYFHPHTEGGVDWKFALTEAYGKISATTNNDQFAEIIEGMLAHLEDPVTRLWRKAELESAAQSTDASPIKQLAPDFMLLTIRDDGHFSESLKTAIERLNQYADKIVDCKNLIIDLRSSLPGGKSHFPEALEKSRLCQVLIDKPVSEPQRSLRFYWGLPPSQGTTSGAYKKFRKSLEAASFKPLKGACNKRVVFIVDKYSYLPKIASALQAQGTGYVIAAGPLRAAAGNIAHSLIIPGLGTIDVRLSESMKTAGNTGGAFTANEEVAPGEGAIERAKLWLESGASSKKQPAKSPSGKSRDSWGRRDLPDELDRAYAAVKIWFIFRYFFPYLSLMKGDWDALLVKYMPDFLDSKTALDYGQAAARMTAHLGDSHISVRSKALGEFLWPAASPFTCRMIEGKAVVVTCSSTAAKCGLQVGDVIQKVDGEDVLDKMKTFSQYVSASTPQAESIVILDMVFRGEAGSKAKLEIVSEAQTKTVQIERTKAPRRSWGQDYPQTPVIEIIEGSIGYVNLSLLKKTEVAQMFERLKDTTGIIFDMRGYPNGTAWTIGPRLVSRTTAGSITTIRGLQKTSISAAAFRYSLNPALDGGPSPFHKDGSQDIFWSDDWKYAGKTVMLIDERAISQAEHTGLHLKAANGTIFIGMPTAGANGDVTNFSIPGSVLITLTGLAIEHPDGHPLQRIGLVPDIKIAPTIAGTRNGEDEILQGAIKYLRLKC